MPVDLISNILQKNRSANVSGPAFFYLVDTANIDYRIKGIQENNSLVPELVSGNKYIIRNASNLNPAFGTIAGVANNDIVIYETSIFSVYLDVSNSITNKGAVVYNDTDNKLYYYNGTQWNSLGLGSLVGSTNIEVLGSTGNVQINLRPIVVIENYIQTPILMFGNGITMGGVGGNVQLTGNLNITGSLTVNGEVVTNTAFRGAQGDADIEQITDVQLDAGDY